MTALRTFAAILLAVPLARAQEQLRVQGPTPAVVVLGSTARVDLVVEGRTADPKPFQVPRVDGLVVRVAGPSRQSITSFDGRGRVDTVFVQYQLLLEPQREGSFTIPSFRINTGTTLQTVPQLELRAVKQLRGAEHGYLDVKLERTRVYVHEPVRARVEFGVDAGLQPVQDVFNRRRYVDFEVRAPWLTDMPGAVPVELPEVQGDSILVVCNRTLQYAEYAANYERQGRTWRSFVIHREFLPTRPGTYDLDPVLLRYHVQLSEGRRGLFGERVGGQSENYYVYGEPLRLEVLPIPEEGRPTPFYGAVGRFTIDASLDRDTVKVGASLKLKLLIRGSGNFEFLRVPEFDGWEAQGWHLLGSTEQRGHDEMTVTYDLTPLSADVRTVPAVAWNFFDTTPGVERFREVRTEPLRVTVQPLADAATLAPLPEEAHGAVTPGVDDIFDLPDLTGPPVVVREPGAGLVAALVLGPWVVLALAGVAFALRRRALADPAQARARAAARVCERALAAGEEPVAAFARYLGDRLGLPPAAVIGDDLRQRLAHAGIAAPLADEAATAVENGIAARYGGGAPLDAARVRELVRALEPVAVRRGARAGSIALLVALLAAGAGRAQDDAAAAGHAAYRQGDYAAAEAAFARALQGGDDRRLWFARGNSFYRLGDLPRAVWAWECARLGMPRDDELLANLALARRRLELDNEPGSFGAALLALRRRVTTRELAWLCGAAMALAALGVALGRRRPAWRWLAVAMLLPGVLFALELLWLGPSRPQRAVALRSLELVAEPREGLAPVATVRPGAVVALQSGTAGTFARVRAGDRVGYAPTTALAAIE